ncbi:MAG: MgtC/SapB family protein [Spirochaetales bacterium]|nr:MgtC/SapB family protein [Spirochaetales bacterium]
MHFDLAPMFNYFTLVDYLDIGLRIILSAVCGAIIGLERERRYKNAGLRTHVIVAISAAILMIVSKYGFIDIASIPDARLTSDGGRIAAGVIQSIGFLGAGVIFVRKESIIGLTTAAGLWATVGIGMCFGCGMYILGISATLILVLVNILLRIHHQKIAFQTIVTVSSHVSKHGMTLNQFNEELEKAGARLRDFTFSRNENNEIFVKANVVLSDKLSIMEHVDILTSLPFVDTFEVYPS